MSPRRRACATSLLLSAVLCACTSKIDDKPKAEVQDARATADVPTTPPSAGGPTLDKAKSSIGFIGAKITGADHEGSFSDFTAELVLEGDVPKALVIEVKTDSMQVEPERLRDHLKSADFFDTDKYPAARFTSVSMTPKADGTSTHAVEGALHLHGEKKVVTFPATLTIDENTATGRAELTIDRKDFGVDAGLADALVQDDVLLKIDLTFTR